MLSLSRVVRKPDFCICENKDADQLRGNREADQRLCFRYSDSTIPLLPTSEISSLLPSSVVVQPGLCRTWWETPKTGFLTTRLNYQAEWTFPSLSIEQVHLHLSCVTRKPAFGVSDQVRYKSGCTTTKDD